MPAAGRMGAAEARQRLREALAAQGYEPEPGQQGSIKDLGSTRRLQVAIDTNVELARGWAQRQTALQNYVRPAQELYRAGVARQPRDWDKRWQEAADAVGWEGVSRERLYVALKTSPIWRALSRFDQPYPPFDFGSHMRTRSVSLEDARAAGLLTDPEELAAAQQQQRKEALASLNESVECTPQVTARELRQQLADVLQGLAEWRGDTLVMTDPNGTRPYPPEEIGRVITAPLPRGYENRQADAFKAWVKDSSSFEGDKPEVGRDKVEDVRRLFERIESKESTEHLYRGIHFKDESKLKEFEKLIHERSVCSPKQGRVADSFSSSRSTAESYAGQTQYQAVIIVRRHKSAKDLRGLYGAVTPYKQDVHHPVHLESEHIILSGTRLKITGKSRETLQGGGVRITYECEEI